MALENYSWKTTTAGVLTIVVAVGGGVLVYLKTGQMPSLEPIVAQVLLGVGMLTARDNNRSSEDVGAKEVARADFERRNL